MTKKIIKLTNYQQEAFLRKTNKEFEALKKDPILTLVIMKILVKD